MAPPDPILGLLSAFRAEARPNKVNLGVGIYLWEPIMESVQKAELRMAAAGENKYYLPIDGDPDYLKLLHQLLLGKTHDRIFGAQTVGGTSALRLAGDCLRQLLDHKAIYICKPTWGNHLKIFPAAGLSIEEYQMDAIESVPPGSPILFHTCCQNPTGIDPTEEEWRQIATTVKKNKLLPIFDTAYQGFGDGLEEDVFSVRHFVEEGIDLMVTYSCSKNFGLYSERTGALFVATPSRQVAERLGSRAKQLIRTNYSNPPCHGARIVRTILSDETLAQEWRQEVDQMRTRIHEMRDTFAERTGLRIAQQKGMFSFLGMNKEQVERLTLEFAIYLPASGRINLTGLTAQNLDYVVEAIATCREKT